jgi:hypothetical protein
VLALTVYGFQLHIYDQTPETRITIRQVRMLSARSILMQWVLMMYWAIDHHGYGNHIHWHYDPDEALHLVLLPAHHVVGVEPAVVDCDLG